jgi:hypothetical protein
MVTARDVARLAGVSTSTVSHVRGTANGPARRVLLAAGLRVRESSGSLGPAEGEFALPPAR